MHLLRSHGGALAVLDVPGARLLEAGRTSLRQFPTQASPLARRHFAIHLTPKQVH